MFTKSAIAAALVVGSLSSAFAFNNIGEIDNGAPRATVYRPLSARALDARAQAQVQVQPQTFIDRAWLDHPTENISSQ